MTNDQCCDPHASGDSSAACELGKHALGLPRMAARGFCSRGCPRGGPWAFGAPARLGSFVGHRLCKAEHAGQLGDGDMARNGGCTFAAMDGAPHCEFSSCDAGCWRPRRRVGGRRMAQGVRMSLRPSVVGDWRASRWALVVRKGRRCGSADGRARKFQRINRPKPPSQLAFWVTRDAESCW